MLRRFRFLPGSIALSLGCSSIEDAGSVALSRDTRHPLEVYAWREGADGAYQRDPAPLARGLSSLHPVLHDGEVWTPVLQSIREPTWLEEVFPALRVAFLTSGDGRSWRYRVARVDAPGHSLIDPAFVEGPEGLELWFVQHDAEGDPAHAQGSVRVLRTRWRGASFGDAEVWWTGSTVLDPAPVHDGARWRVFATQGIDVVELAPDGRSAPVLSGATVPWAFHDADGVGLLAQRLTDGKMLPIVVRPGVAGWTAEPVALRMDAASQGTRTCASPGIVAIAGGRTLLCVDETQAHGGHSADGGARRGDAGRPSN